MPVDFKDLDGGLGKAFNGRGVVTVQEVVEAVRMDMAQDLEKFRKYRYAFSDFTAVTDFRISADGVKEVAQVTLEGSRINPDMAVAVVAYDDLVYGSLRMWEMLNDETAMETAIFRDREAAKTWLRKRVKERFGIDDITFE